MTNLLPQNEGDAVTGNEVLDRAVTKTDSGRVPAEPPSRPRDRNALRILALLVVLAIAGVLAGAKPWASLLSIFNSSSVAVQLQDAVAVAEFDYINSVFAHNVAKLRLARPGAAEDWGIFSG